MVLFQTFFARTSFLRRCKWPYLAILLLSILFSACSGLSFGNSTPTPHASPTPKPTPVPAILNLSRLPWCDKPVMVFRDLTASGTAVTLSDWTQIKPLLGFTVYLPSTLSNGSCLVSASGTVHDPILGGNFVIGYIMADHSSLTLSQAPQRAQSAVFQCSTTPGGTKIATPILQATPQGPDQFCSGVHGSTHIVFSATGNTDVLQQFFNALQPDVSWIPAS